MKYLIIGGTGSLGKAMLKQLYCQKGAKISVFSRGELNQVALRQIYPKANFIIGDIRDYDAVKMVTKDKDAVFHFAAIKHVDIIESNISESIKTNILGTQNVGTACMENDVRRVVFSSTDKAVFPINVYGMCKGISEKYLLNLNDMYGKEKRNRFKVYRWGNVLASSGSAIPFFVISLLKSKSVNITDSNMTRFWLPIERAVEFILETYESYDYDDVLIPNMKAAKVERVVGILAALLGVKDYKVNYIGIRPGEKIHECVHYKDGHGLYSNTCEQYTDNELVALLEPYVRSIVD